MRVYHPEFRMSSPGSTNPSSGRRKNPKNMSYPKYFRPERGSSNMKLSDYESVMSCMPKQNVISTMKPIFSVRMSMSVTS